MWYVVVVGVILHFVKWCGSTGISETLSWHFYGLVSVSCVSFYDFWTNWEKERDGHTPYVLCSLYVVCFRDEFRSMPGCYRQIASRLESLIQKFRVWVKCVWIRQEFMPLQFLNWAFLLFLLLSSSSSSARQPVNLALYSVKICTRAFMPKTIVLRVFTLIFLKSLFTSIIRPP